MSPQAADPQEPFRAIAEKMVKDSFGLIVVSKKELVELAIRLTVEATHAEYMVDEKYRPTDAEIASRLAELLDKEQT